MDIVQLYVRVVGSAFRSQLVMSSTYSDEGSLHDSLPSGGLYSTEDAIDGALALLVDKRWPLCFKPTPSPTPRASARTTKTPMLPRAMIARRFHHGGGIEATLPGTAATLCWEVIWYNVGRL
jgi:hypothetical protein